MPDVVGLIGIIIVFAGIHLLWQSRHGFMYWLERFVRIFRASLGQSDAVSYHVSGGETSPRKTNAVRIVIGMGLAFFVGPILIALSLAF